MGRKTESPFLKSLLCVMLVARGKECLVGAISFERSFECRWELAVALVEVVGLETGTLAGSRPCSAVPSNDLSTAGVLPQTAA